MSVVQFIHVSVMSFILHHATFKKHVRLAEHRGTDCDPRIKTRQAVGRGMLQLHLDIGGSLMQVKSFADHFSRFISKFLILVCLSTIHAAVQVVRLI